MTVDRIVHFFHQKSKKLNFQHKTLNLSLGEFYFKMKFTRRFLKLKVPQSCIVLLSNCMIKTCKH